MCGIAGIYQQGADNTALMKQMLNIMEHRGPDAATVYRHGDVTLGHRRLSIIDLEGGHQPMFNEKRTLCVVYNGEIYNYLDLRKDLIAKGHIFATSSDTEVLVHGFEEYGTDLFRKLNGIFAFALLDMVQHKIFLVRDHFGVKPLHYHCSPGLLVFGSEQKSILLHPKFKRAINLQSLHSHLNLRYTQSNDTLFQGIQRLPPAHYAEYSEGKISVKRFWKLEPAINHRISEEEAVEQLHHYVKQAVQRQLMSEVPLGVYLSGGLDSSTIVQKMHELGVENINTFTMGFNEPTDEFPDAERIHEHFHTRHRTLSLSMNPMDQFPEVIWHAEEPKINLLQGFHMSKFVKQEITVVLGGLGGDELFGGYDIYRLLQPFNTLNRFVPAFMHSIGNLQSSLLFHMQNATGALQYDEYRRGMQILASAGQISRMYLLLRNEWDFDRNMHRNIYSDTFLRQNLDALEPAYKEFEGVFQDVHGLSDLDKVLYAEFNTKMVNDYLLTEDRMSMANSVEERVPFLDRDLVEFGFSLPAHLKVKNGQTKYIFRKAMEGLLPPQIITKKKWGFTVNPYMQFKKDLKHVAERVLTEEFVEAQGIFNYAYIRKILDYAPSPKLRWHYNYLWIVLGIAIWQKMFIDSDAFKNKEVQLESFYQ